MNQHGAAGDPVRLADCTSALENVYLSICAVGKVTIAIPVGVSTNAGTVGVVVATLSAMDDNLGILVIVEGSPVYVAIPMVFVDSVASPPACTMVLE